MIWATNETLALLRYNSHVCINATFRSTPKDFSQCLAIMTFDLGSQTFEPWAYAFITGKLEYLYSIPKYETTDIEKEFMNQLNTNFVKIVPQNIEAILVNYEFPTLFKQDDIINAIEYIKNQI
ncbi:hypothetical protein HZS_7971, partial [Henneguya salminicola]